MSLFKITCDKCGMRIGTSLRHNAVRYREAHNLETLHPLEGIKIRMHTADGFRFLTDADLKADDY